MSADNDNLKPRFSTLSVGRLEDDLDDEKLAGNAVN